MRFLLAWKYFWKVLLDAEFAHRLEQPAEAAPKVAEPAPAQHPPPAQRSDAITLLAALQREARFVDIVMESLDGYSDAQIGAAARDVFRDSAQVLDRVFGLQPVVGEEEGADIEVPAGYDAGRYRLVGNLSQEPPLTGNLTHAGWRASKCEVPAWTGRDEAASIVAPAEVQIG